MNCLPSYQIMGHLLGEDRDAIELDFFPSYPLMGKEISLCVKNTPTQIMVCEMNPLTCPKMLLQLRPNNILEGLGRLGEPIKA